MPCPCLVRNRHLPIRTFLCWYGRPDVTPPDAVMSRYDLIVGAACPPERRDALRRLKANIRFVVYVNAIDCRVVEGLVDVERFDTGRRAVEHRHGRSHDRDLWTNHRDFFLRNRRGARGDATDPREAFAWGYHRPYEATSREANRFFLDPRSGWRDYYPELCANAMQRGDYDGVFCDNAGPRIEWDFEHVGDDLKADITDPEWSRAMATMLSNVARRLKRDNPDARVFANTCGGFVCADADDIEPADFWRDARIDGAMDEFFAFAERPGRDAYLPQATWRQQVRAILCCEKLGRSYIAQANGDEHNHAARVYALASFLIGAGERSVFNYNHAPAAKYPLVYRFPEWDIDLGVPIAQYESLDEALDAGEGRAYARKFERGLVLVNPTDAPVDGIAVPADARRLALAGGTLTDGGRAAWEAVDTPVSLPPHAAAILSCA